MARPKANASKLVRDRGYLYGVKTKDKCNSIAFPIGVSQAWDGLPSGVRDTATLFSLPHAALTDNWTTRL